MRIQWDPERNFALEPLAWRTIQMGLSGVAAENFVNRWTVDITDITHVIHELRQSPTATPKLPAERPYPLDSTLASRIGAN